MRTHLCVVICALTISGCAVQATSGVAWSGERAPRVPVTTGLTTQAFRESQGIFGLRMVTLVDRGFEIRSGIAHVGYDIVNDRRRWALEPGLDLGIGGPVRPIYPGVGGYAGISGNARYRLWGEGDQRPAYDLLFQALDVVVMPRAGLWMGPEERHEGTMFGDLALEIGLRFAIGSDVIGSKQGVSPDAPTEGQKPR